MAAQYTLQAPAYLAEDGKGLCMHQPGETVTYSGTPEPFMTPLNAEATAAMAAYQASMTAAFPETSWQEILKVISGPRTGLIT
jgi:hypothetical protein